MRYRADILTLYDQLFGDASSMLTKEAGVVDWFGRLLAKPGRIQRAESQVSRLEQAVKDQAHRQGLAEFDIAASQAAQQRAEQELAKRTKELAQLGAKPGQLGRLKALAAGGALAGGVGLAAAPLAYGSAQRAAEEQRRRTRNIAFGAGAAAGIAAPQVVRGLGRIAQGVGQTGLYPELEGFTPGTEGGY